ncbi:hypothetical protein [Streptomyces humi]
MDFRITAEEEALVLRRAEFLDAGTQPQETQLVEQVGRTFGSNSNSSTGRAGSSSARLRTK